VPIYFLVITLRRGAQLLANLIRECGQSLPNRMRETKINNLVRAGDTTYSSLFAANRCWVSCGCPLWNVPEPYHKAVLRKSCPAIGGTSVLSLSLSHGLPAPCIPSIGSSNTQHALSKVRHGYAFAHLLLEFGNFLVLGISGTLYFGRELANRSRGSSAWTT
jgi:hypothetical protein